MIQGCFVNFNYTYEVIMFNLRNLFLYILFLFLPLTLIAKEIPREKNCNCWQ